MKKSRYLCIALCSAMMFTACSSNSQSTASSSSAVSQSSAVTKVAFVDLDDQISIDEDEVPLASAPISSNLAPVASGVTVYSNDKAKIDASNTSDGYIMVAFTGSAKGKLKVIVTGPSGVKYTYDLTSNGNYEVFPLSDGNGNYSISIYENVSGNKYSTVFTQDISVKLKSEFAPFLLPNQYVNFNSSSKTVAKAKELTSGCSTDLDKITNVYNYVVENISYDKQKAATVQSGYLPDVDSILASKKGICFDYAAVMTAMLRSQGIPCKLVVGYAGTAYHAWINAYTKENGWVDNVILFDGKTWKLMDPTFASSANKSDSVMQYIGNGANYSAKYLY